ncbi:MAG: hypothetical protein A2W99_07420 [Bacteroidetes bacterium GWF2_33_16]|nr:MAG: hypothetical protein A2X00_10370 [Bacteroidetes bacterium GWE2_32_14]OFY03037.1 MAG: hypothetical protein A2W99_07420 [Bacteroidetes bacterium GWF2_33_16]
MIQSNCKIEDNHISNNIKKYFQNNKWIAGDDFDKMQSNKNTISYEKSISFLYPDLVNEWHPDKNETYLPSQFSPGSHKKIWWKGKCGLEWIAAIYSRASGINCPICANRQVDETNCLATLYPKLSKEWHPTKNGELTPYNVTPGSHKKIWWRNNVGREWEAEIRSRVSKIRNKIDTNQLNLFED